MNLKLNNPQIITATQKMHNCEIEVIYWKMEDALTDNKQEDALSMLKMLLYFAKYRSRDLSASLKPIQIKRVKEIIRYSNFG